MIRTLTLCLLLAAAATSSAQTFFYIDQIAVSPAAPTTSDNVSIQLIGDLSDTGASILVADAGVGGYIVSITLVANSDGGLTVLVPHTETLQLGQLAAGTYTIDFTDASIGIWDGAPPEQHTFTVTGDGSEPCDDLELVSVYWHPFTDTALVVHVRNNSTALFDYPNFILLDDANDTLAVETVNFFGIGEESWHVMQLREGVELPNVPFSGRLELWTQFTSELACAWEHIFDPCPPEPCSELSPTLMNVGGSVVTGLFNWGVFDDGVIVANGQFELTTDVQYTDTTICLPPGNYGVNVSPVDPGQTGILYYSVTTPGFLSTPSAQVTTSLPMLMPFSFFGPCIPGGQSVQELLPDALLTAPVQGGLQVWNNASTALGPVWLFDAQGRLLFHTTATTDRLLVPVQRPGVYILRAGERTVKVLAGLE